MAVPPYAAGTGTDTLTFAIPREDGAAPAPTVIVEGDSLALNGDAIESTTGLVADIAHPGAARAGFAGPELASIGASDGEAREGEALEFRLELSQASETAVSVDYETAEGTAHEGADYLPLSGTVSFAPGETVKTVAVATLGDGDAEPAETLILRLSNAQGATLATPEASGTIAANAAAGALTGAFSAVPDEHDGTEAFTLTLTFSGEPSGLSYKTVRDSLFTGEGGTIEGARREGPPSNRSFVLTVKPGGNEAVKLSLKAVPPCGQDKTVCTAGGSVLSGPLGVTVPGPAALSMADAEVQEGPGAVLEFVVSLDRVRHATVRVDYATANGEAVAGDDYVHTAGTLTFAPGETGHIVSVPVLADEHDEDSETLTLRLANPVGARIADDEAVGTIRNNGAIPKAWIARFGRTVAEQVLEAVEGRMRATPAPGVEVALAGERIGGQAEPGNEEERDARREEEARREAQRFPRVRRVRDAPRRRRPRHPHRILARHRQRHREGERAALAPGHVVHAQRRIVVVGEPAALPRLCLRQREASPRSRRSVTALRSPHRPPGSAAGSLNELDPMHYTIPQLRVNLSLHPSFWVVWQWRRFDTACRQFTEIFL